MTSRFCLVIKICTWQSLILKRWEFGSFLCPPVSYVPPVTEHVPLHSKSSCKNMARSFGGANNMRPLCWGTQTEKIPIVIRSVQQKCPNKFLWSFRTVNNQVIRQFLHHNGQKTPREKTTLFFWWCELVIWSLNKGSSDDNRKSISI